MKALLVVAALSVAAASTASLAAPPGPDGTNAPGAGKPLEVCADPSNLPYSSDHEDGFENRIATVLAADMQTTVHTTWNMERRSFFRRTLLAGACDVVISVPSNLPIVATTRPYFTSGYVFVTRRKDGTHFASFDDPGLQDARIGLQMLGAEGANPPPAMALARRGLTRHITGFSMWASEDVANPQGRIVDAVASGQIDVAMVWGPFAGYFAKPYGDALRIEPIAGDPAQPELAFTYAMSVGVRRSDTALRDRLQLALDRHKAEIDTILHDYGVPLVKSSPSAMQ